MGKLNQIDKAADSKGKGIVLLTSTICCVIIITESAYFVVIIAERMIFDEYSRSAKAHFA